MAKKAVKKRQRRMPSAKVGVPIGNVVKRKEDVGKPRYTPHGYLPDGKLPVTDGQWWRRRAKHGRDILFQSPELLWEAACEYFQYIKENPWMRNEVKVDKRRGAYIVAVPMSRPFTLHALCLYLGCSVEYFKMFIRSTLPAMEDGEVKKNFFIVISAIESVMYTQKFEGAAVGAFNANIISRDLGLADTTNINYTDMNRKSTAQLFPLDPVGDDVFEEAKIIEENNDDE
jgi:hypothetical protein